MNRILETGSLVELRGQQWLLTGTQQFGKCRVLSLAGRDRDNVADRLRVIEPFDRARRSSSGKPKLRKRRAVLRRALEAMHSSRPPGSLWTAAGAKIALHSYQLEPALSALSGAMRLLLADGVGLGKTIQAGLLLSELLQRGWIERALIVCPSGLRDTWQRELRDRFAITSHVIDQAALADRIASCPPGVNPWDTGGVSIVSIDFVKREEILAALDGVPIDLLVADEAHHLSPGTDRGAAMARLASRAVWCVLVSATPHSGDREAFDFLTSIGRHGDSIAIFRRSRRDVGLVCPRHERFLAVRGTPVERSLFAAVAGYARAVWLARGRSDHAARLVAITIARRAASSRSALERTLTKRLDLLRSAPHFDDQPRLPWDDTDERDDVAADSVLCVQGLDDVSAECAALEQLIELSRRGETASKIDRLIRLLTRIGEPAIVFTEYRDTLEFIRIRLARLRRVCSIHGGLAVNVRRQVVDEFNHGAHDVLIATDAAGEGLNLHHRCRLVIDFELPWSPLRLEQRIGRVDRFGQRRAVHAIRLFHNGSIEEEVLDRLSLRQRRATGDLDRAISESDVAESVFCGAVLSPGDSPRLRTTRVAGIDEEFQRVANQRNSHARWRRTSSWTAAMHERAMHVFLHRSSFFNAHGTFVADELNAHEASCPSSARAIHDVSAYIRRQIDRHSIADTASRSGAIGRRIAAIRRQVARDQRREYQRSLFDGRADADQAERKQGVARIGDALIRIEHAVAMPSPGRTRIELVAAWPKVRR